MKKWIVILAALAIMVSGFAATSAAPAGATFVSSDGHEYEGEWLISSYREGDVQTAKFDGRVVTISKQGAVFRVDGPSTEEAATAYFLAGNDLVGTLIPDGKLIKEAFPTLPNPSLGQAIASGKISYNGRLSMGQDGSIQVEFDGITLSWKHNAFTNYFDYVQSKPGWYKYTLTRIGASPSAVNTNGATTSTGTDADKPTRDRINAIRNRQQ